MDISEFDNAFIGKNIRAARRELDLELKDVEQRLSQIGHPLGVNTLSKLETNRRKITAVELVHLAVVLEATPNRLLFGGVDLHNTESPIALRIGNDLVASSADLWGWADGWTTLGHSERLSELTNDLKKATETWPTEGVDSEELMKMRVKLREHMARDREFQRRNRVGEPPSDTPAEHIDELRRDGRPLHKFAALAEELIAQGLNWRDLTWELTNLKSNLKRKAGGGDEDASAS